MRKKSLVLALVLSLLFISGIIYLLNTKADDREAATMEDKVPSSQAVDQPSVATTTSAGTYIVYTNEAFTNAKGTRLLFFHAPWCPQCRDLDKDITKTGVPDGVTILKVDYDSSQDLRKQYGVTLQTTVVRVDEAGKLIEKFVAYDEPTLQAVKDALL